jgi:hypothetical protein
MPLSIRVESQIHGELYRIFDNEDHAYRNMFENTPRGTLLRGVDPHGDTMFNPYQLEIVLEEISTLRAQYPQHQDRLQELAEGARAAIRKSGYLYFVGD